MSDARDLGSSDHIFAGAVRPGMVRGPRSADPRVCAGCQWPFLAEISAMVASITTDFDSTLLAILGASVRLVGGERGILMLFDENGKLRVRVAHNIEETQLQVEVLRFSKTIVNRVLRKRQGLAIPEITADASESMVAMGIRSVMCVPLVMQVTDDSPHQVARASALIHAHDGILGVIYVDSTEPASRFDEYELDVFQALANQASTVLLGSAYYRQATIDGLTGTLRGSHFSVRLEEECRLAAAEGQELALLAIDVDRFKDTNDRAGHPTGDRILGRLGKLFMAAAGRDDLVARLGGDEFAILLFACTAARGRAFAEELRVQVEAMSTRGSEGARPQAVTISIGIVSSGEVGGEAQRMVAEADRRLYLAKSLGRNRVHGAGDD